MGNARREPSPEASRRIAGGRAPQDLPVASRKTRRRENHRIVRTVMYLSRRDRGLAWDGSRIPRTPAGVRTCFVTAPVVSRRHGLRNDLGVFIGAQPPADME